MVAREDVLCAGAIVAELQHRNMVNSLDDQGLLAYDAWRGCMARGSARETGAPGPGGLSHMLGPVQDPDSPHRCASSASHSYSASTVNKESLRADLAMAKGGMNIAGLGLGEDIALAASVDLFPDIAPELFAGDVLKQSK